MRLAKILILLVLCFAGAQICPASGNRFLENAGLHRQGCPGQTLKDDEQELDGYCLRLGLSANCRD